MPHTSKYWRLRGRDVRVIAEKFDNLSLKEKVLNLADGYDYIADQIEVQERLEGRVNGYAHEGFSLDTS